MLLILSLERLSLTEKEEKDPKVFDEKDFGLVKSNSDLVARLIYYFNIKEHKYCYQFVLKVLFFSNYSSQCCLLVLKCKPWFGFRNAELEAENCKIRKEREKTNQDLKQLQTLSSKLQVSYFNHSTTSKTLNETNHAVGWKYSSNSYEIYI